MKRREFLHLTFSTAVAIAAVHADKTVDAQKSPNLLIIHTDEHNFRTLGCYRRTLPPEQAFIWGEKAVVETPHIDWIAEHGAVCTGFYATTPVCSPSRAAFVSGQYPQNTPVVNNNIALQEGTVTFAETLCRHGYTTGYAGKWHLDGTGKPQWAPKRQFGFADNRYMFNRGHWKMLEDTSEGPRVAAQKNNKPTYDVKGATKDNFTTDFLANQTIEFIKKHKNEPFCYMVSIPDPHGPNSVRVPYDTMYDNIEFKLPRTAGNPPKELPVWSSKKTLKMNNNLMSKYFGMVKCIDDNVGRILDTLRAEKLIDNTIIVFTSDHGDLCFEHNMHNKGNPYETSAKIPFVLYYPEKVKAGTTIHEALSCVDFLPTILSMMDVPTAGKEQGRDASVLFMKGKAPADWNDVVFIRGTGKSKSKDTNSWLAAITKRYKIVYHPEDKPWLFDLEKDPDELINFYTDPAYQDIVKRLAAALIEYGKTYSDPRISVASVKKELEKVL